MKVSVFIEEHLCREVIIDVSTNDVDEAMGLAEEQAKEMYKNEEIVLTADDFNGVRQMMVECGDYSTSWNEF